MREAERAATPPEAGGAAPVVEAGAVRGVGRVATIAAEVLEAEGASLGPGAVHKRALRAPVSGAVVAATPVEGEAATPPLRCGTRGWGLR